MTMGYELNYLTLVIPMHRHKTRKFLILLYIKSIGSCWFLSHLMEQSDENWSTGFYQSLSSLSVDRANADVTLWLGNHPIYAHKFVLDANSSIMQIEDVLVLTDRKYYVTLPAEFEENFELISAIITSFYTGIIEVKDDYVNFLHKFGNLYDITWLKMKTLTLYKRLLTKNTFVKIFKFSHSICCKDLQELCLDHLTENMFEFLFRSGELLEIDYFCVKTICDTGATNCAFVPEMRKFQFVCKWFETDVPNRICHLESIMSSVGFNTLENSEVTVAFNWILENKHIDENQKMNLMKKVNLKLNSPVKKVTTDFKEH